MLRIDYIPGDADAPPAPQLGALRATGIPIVSDAQCEAAVRDADVRRALLGAYVENSGWTWEAVAAADSGAQAH